MSIGATRLRPNPLSMQPSRDCGLRSCLRHVRAQVVRVPVRVLQISRWIPGRRTQPRLACMVAHHTPPSRPKGMGHACLMTPPCLHSACQPPRHAGTPASTCIQCEPVWPLTLQYPPRQPMRGCHHHRLPRCREESCAAGTDRSDRTACFVAPLALSNRRNPSTSRPLADRAGCPIQSNGTAAMLTSFKTASKTQSRRTRGLRPMGAVRRCEQSALFRVSASNSHDSHDSHDSPGCLGCQAPSTRLGCEEGVSCSWLAFDQCATDCYFTSGHGYEY